VKPPERNPLPDDRYGDTIRVMIGDTKVFVTINEYPDGTIGEIFVAIGKEGGIMRIYDAFFTSISIGLQYGIPLHVFVDKFRFQAMKPDGFTDNALIPNAKSVIDFVFRLIEIKYVGKD